MEKPGKGALPGDDRAHRRRDGDPDGQRLLELEQVLVQILNIAMSLTSFMIIRVPWTSQEIESDMAMLIKSRIIAAKTLQTEWDTQV